MKSIIKAVLLIWTIIYPLASIVNKSWDPMSWSDPTVGLITSITIIVVVIMAFKSYIDM